MYIVNLKNVISSILILGKSSIFQKLNFLNVLIIIEMFLYSSGYISQGNIVYNTQLNCQTYLILDIFSFQFQFIASKKVAHQHTIYFTFSSYFNSKSNGDAIKRDCRIIIFILTLQVELNHIFFLAIFKSSNLYLL